MPSMTLESLVIRYMLSSLIWGSMIFLSTNVVFLSLPESYRLRFSTPLSIQVPSYLLDDCNIPLLPLRALQPLH